MSNNGNGKPQTKQVGIVGGSLLGPASAGEVIERLDEQIFQTLLETERKPDFLTVTPREYRALLISQVTSYPYTKAARLAKQFNEAQSPTEYPPLEHRDIRIEVRES